MWHDMFLAFWFLLPAALANAAPIIAAKIPFIQSLDQPIDGGVKLGKHRLLGSHKTWRGLISGIIIATAILYLQQLAVTNSGWLQNMTNQVDYSQLPVLLLGPLFGLGALGGDAIKSFFKRRVGIASGRSWLPFDQIDYIIGAIIASLPIVRLGLAEYAWMLVIWFIAHLVTSYVGWLLKLKERPV